MNAKTIASIQAELETAQWIASSSAMAQAELAIAQWIGRPAATTKSTRGASR